jgi:lipoteichoic acid synthase
LYKTRDDAREELTHSDNVMAMDLLRFYSPSSIQGFEPNDYIYTNQLDYLESRSENSSSLLSEREGHSSELLYESDAPELIDEMNFSDFIQTLDPDIKPNIEKLN